MKKIILAATVTFMCYSSFAQTDSTNNQMNRHRDKTIDPNMTHQSISEIHPDGVMKENGKIMVVENGKMSMMSQDLILKDGTRVMNDGTYIKKDGTKMMLKNGEHIDMLGTIIPMEDSKNMYLVPDSTIKK